MDMIAAGGILISAEAFRGASVHERQVVLALAGLFDGDDMELTTSTKAEAETEVYETARLGERQWRRFLEGVSPKTRSVLVAISELPPKFAVNDFYKQVGISRDEWRTLTSAWAGITRRLRNITNDSEAELLFWGSQDKDGVYQTAEMHPETHAALRAALSR